MTSALGGGAGGVALGTRGMRSSDSSAFIPLQHDNNSHAWNASTASLNTPYHDDTAMSRSSTTGMSADYDPYSSTPMQHPPSSLGRETRY